MGISYYFKVIYKKGKDNVVADALAKKQEDSEALICVVSILQVDWVK